MALANGTSGTTAFNLNMNDLLEEAFERCGKELRSGYDFRTARRSINLLTIEWANKGINMWTVEQNQIPLNTGQAIYPLPLDTIDILDAVTRTYNGQTNNQQDLNINRIAEPTYLSIPNKNAYDRPVQFYVNRLSGNVASVPQASVSAAILPTDTTINLVDASTLPTQGFINIDTETIGYQNIIGNQIVNAWRAQNGTVAAAHAVGAPVFVNNIPNINIWPTPSAPGNQWTLVYYRMRRIQDAGDGTNVEDIPFRFIPAMVAGLAYHLSMKLDGVDPTRAAALKMSYDEVFMQAAEEDRDKASWRIVPRLMNYFR